MYLQFYKQARRQRLSPLSENASITPQKKAHLSDGVFYGLGIQNVSTIIPGLQISTQIF